MILYVLEVVLLTFLASPASPSATLRPSGQPLLLDSGIVSRQ